MDSGGNRVRRRCAHQLGAECVAVPKAWTAGAKTETGLSSMVCESDTLSRRVLVLDKKRVPLYSTGTHLSPFPAARQTTPVSGPCRALLLGERNRQGRRRRRPLRGGGLAVAAAAAASSPWTAPAAASPSPPPTASAAAAYVAAPPRMSPIRGVHFRRRARAGPPRSYRLLTAGLHSPNRGVPVHRDGRDGPRASRQGDRLPHAVGVTRDGGRGAVRRRRRCWPRSRRRRRGPAPARPS